jgi:hypothetical protein
MNSDQSSFVENDNGGKTGGEEDVYSDVLPLPFPTETSSVTSFEVYGRSCGRDVRRMFRPRSRGEFGVWMENMSAEEEANEDGESAGTPCAELPKENPDSRETANKSC